MGCLYQLTFPNGKSYIGISRKTADQRFAAHCTDARARQYANLPLYRALRKYGDACITVKTLALCDDWKHLQQMERTAIVKLGTRTPAGYNATDGGDGRAMLGRRHTEQTKAKMRETHLGLTHRTGWKHTNEAKAKISTANRGNAYALGRKMSTVEKQQRSNAERNIYRGASSGYVGVSWHDGAFKWRAHVTRHRKFIHLGFHSTVEDAILARLSFLKSEEERGRQNGCQTTA